MFIRSLFVLILGFSSLSAKVSFNDEVRPLLSNSCYRCHGPDEEDRKAKLRLDTREGATKDHKGFTAISPGKVEDSELIYRIVTDDEDEMMPPPGKGARFTK
ncbi:chromosome segregation protein, partial [bacterium]|nr:chromosome segregation protein [bacterium]